MVERGNCLDRFASIVDEAAVGAVAGAAAGTDFDIVVQDTAGEQLDRSRWEIELAQLLCCELHSWSINREVVRYPQRYQQ